MESCNLDSHNFGQNGSQDHASPRTIKEPAVRIEKPTFRFGPGRFGCRARKGSRS